jgi:hypothetical protein
MLCAAFAFVVSVALLAEYHAVLLRPKLSRLHGLSEAEIEVILADWVRHAIVLNPLKTGAAPNAPDAAISFYGTCWQVAPI